MGDNRIKLIKAMAFGTSIGMTFVFLVGGGYFLGRFLDQTLETYPIFRIVCMLLGIILGGSYLFVSLRKFGEFNDKK